MTIPQVLHEVASLMPGIGGVSPQVMHDEACWLLENVGVRMNHPYVSQLL